MQSLTHSTSKCGGGAGDTPTNSPVSDTSWVSYSSAMTLAYWSQCRPTGSGQNPMFALWLKMPVTSPRHSPKLLINCINCGFPQAHKAEEPEVKLPTSIGSQQKQENSRKASTSASLTKLKLLTVWITTNCGKFFKRWEYQTPSPASWEICMQVQEATVGTGHGTMDWFQIGKGVHQGCILSSCLFNLYMQSISCEMPG